MTKKQLDQGIKRLTANRQRYNSLMSINNKIIDLARFSLVICRNHQNKYLCVLEKYHKWWIVGGGVEKGETHLQAAIREAKEEAGIDIQVKGILAIDQVNFKYPAIRVIYYAEPKDPNQKPKNSGDKESLQADFLDIFDIAALKFKWRAPQIYHYPKYLEQGGQVFPLSCFQEGPLLQSS